MSRAQLALPRLVTDTLTGGADMPKPTACAFCGEPTWSTAVMPAHPKCKPLIHGRAKTYTAGCRCDDCTTAKTEEMRRYRERFTEREGISPTQKYRPARRCVRCGEKVGGGATAREYCASCRNANRSRRRRRRRVEDAIRKAAAGIETTDGRPWVNGECGECGQAFTRKGAASPYCSSACSRKEMRRRRRSRKAGAFVERVYRNQIMERDGWRCQLCGKAVNRRVVAPNPKAPVIDHIIPLAAGGTHEPKNAQCAHFLCNSIKSDGAANDQLRLIG